MELRHASRASSAPDEFDVINDHSGLPAAAIGGAVPTPVGAHGARAARRRAGRGLRADRAGRAARRADLDLDEPAQAEAATCRGSRTARTRSTSRSIPCKPHRGDYLLFLGRMSPDKGAHRAVDVAIAAGLPLKIAGKMREPKEEEYFDEFVEPHLVRRIEYLGEVTHGEKVELLQDARATLFPIEWEEPFGLVMIESMACGTPVIATRWGAVPEVIEHGRSGIIVDDYRRWPPRSRRRTALDPLELPPLRRGAVLAASGWSRTTCVRTEAIDERRGEPHRPWALSRWSAWGAAARRLPGRDELSRRRSHGRRATNSR